jgi:hypothetical protein
MTALRLSLANRQKKDFGAAGFGESYQGRGEVFSGGDHSSTLVKAK